MITEQDIKDISDAVANDVEDWVRAGGGAFDELEAVVEKAVRRIALRGQRGAEVMEPGEWSHAEHEIVIKHFAERECVDAGKHARFDLRCSVCILRYERLWHAMYSPLQAEEPSQ